MYGCTEIFGLLIFMTRYEFGSWREFWSESSSTKCIERNTWENLLQKFALKQFSLTYSLLWCQKLQFWHRCNSAGLLLATSWMDSNFIENLMCNKVLQYATMNQWCVGMGFVETGCKLIHHNISVSKESQKMVVKSRTFLLSRAVYCSE